MKALTIPTLLAIASSLVAQQDTAPAGFLTSEGNYNYYNVFGYQGANSTMNTYFTVLDNTHAGGPSRLFNALSLRRDGPSPTDATYASRTVNMTIRMAHGNYAVVANNSNNPEATWRTTPWVNVFAAKTVNLPDWATAPAGGTAPFNLVFPLDVAFPYNGTSAIAFQFKCTPSSLATSTSYPIDAHNLTPYTEGAQTFSGTGCVATGRSTPMTHSSYMHNFGPGGESTWQVVAMSAPANAPMIAVIGRSNPNAVVGACENLFAAPDFVLAIGAADQNGWVSLVMSFPHQDALIGATLYSQMLAFDALQPGVQFALSRGARATYPANPTFPLAVASGLTRTTGTTFPTGFRLYKGTSMIIGLGY